MFKYYTVVLEIYTVEKFISSYTLIKKYDGINIYRKKLFISDRNLPLDDGCLYIKVSSMYIKYYLFNYMSRFMANNRNIHLSKDAQPVYKKKVLGPRIKCAKRFHEIVLIPIYINISLSEHLYRRLSSRRCRCRHSRIRRRLSNTRSNGRRNTPVSYICEIADLFSVPLRRKRDT